VQGLFFGCADRFAATRDCTPALHEQKASSRCQREDALNYLLSNQGGHAQLNSLQSLHNVIGKPAQPANDSRDTHFADDAVPKALSEQSANAQIAGLPIHWHGLVADVDPILLTILLLSSVTYGSSGPYPFRSFLQEPAANATTIPLNCFETLLFTGGPYANSSLSLNSE
jgi:hypothetical protein